MKAKIVTIVAFIAVFFSLSSCKNESKKAKNSFTVSGTVPGLDTDFMSTSFVGIDGKRVSDSVFVKDNHFSYTATINQPTFVVFWPNVERTIKRSGRGYYPVKSSQFAFLASPGDDIEFKGRVTDFIDAYPTGTKANNDLASINKVIFPLMNKAINLQLKKNKLESNDPSQQKIQKTIDSLDQKVLDLKKDFVVTHPNSEAATWYLSDLMMRLQISDDEAIAAFKTLNKTLNENPFYKEISTRIKGIETTKIGATLPDFKTNNTLDGSTFDMASFKGKYVLVDFWGTWCGPCVGEMPMVQQYQKKYPKRLAILGVNSGEPIEKIKTFLESKKYDWQQIISGKAPDNFVLKFNVSGFPTKFIIDPTGKILYRFVGSGEASFAKLDELLKQ